MIQCMERHLELNQNFFLDDNVDDQKTIIPKKTVKKNSDKNYSPNKHVLQLFKKYLI